MDQGVSPNATNVQLYLRGGTKILSCVFSPDYIRCWRHPIQTRFLLTSKSGNRNVEFRKKNQKANVLWLGTTNIISPRWHHANSRASPDASGWCGVIKVSNGFLESCQLVKGNPCWACFPKNPLVTCKDKKRSFSPQEALLFDFNQKQMIPSSGKERRLIMKGFSQSQKYQMMPPY